jgi:hypothetical protein
MPTYQLAPAMPGIEIQCARKSSGPQTPYGMKAPASSAVTYPAVMSSSSHTRSRQDAGSFSRTRPLRRPGGIGRYGTGISTPAHARASCRRQPA